MKKSRFLPAVSLPAVLLCAALALASGALGEVPQTISYQGYLTDDAGDPLTGPVAITFRLFDVEGPAIWTEAHESVALDEGRFAVALGEIAALPANLGGALSLEIEVNGETLSPRLPLRSAPYALLAGKVDANGVGTDAVVDGAIGKAKLAKDIAGAGLAQNADGSLRVAVGGIGGSMIADGSITNQHIAASAGISPSKINGTAATLGGTETLTNKTLDNPVITVRDSDFTIVDDGDPSYSVRLQLDTPVRFSLQRTLTFPDADGTIALESYVDTQIDNLATVATTGQYKDLVGIPELSAIATSGSFLDLSDVPNFAVLDDMNTFTAPGQAITFDPAGAYPGTVLLRVLGTGERTGGYPVFTVDTEGDVVANSFSGDGMGLYNLQTSELVGTIPVGSITGLAAVATSGSFADLVDTGDAALLSAANVFTNADHAISIEPAGAATDAVLLQITTQSLGRTGYANSPVFTVDAEGDVVAQSFSGDGAGLTNLQSANLTGTIALNLLPTIPASAIDGLASVATSGGFNDLAGVPDFARRDTANVFTAPDQAICLEPIGAAVDAVLLKVMSVSLGRTGSAVFTVDAEGDVMAASFTGDGAGLSNLQTTNLVGTIPASSITGLAAVATSGSFGDLANVPDFARRDTPNVFINADHAISIEPVGAVTDAVQLQIMNTSVVRTGYASPVFTVDTEGDVLATSFTASQLVSVDPFTTVTDQVLLQVLAGNPVRGRRGSPIFTVDAEGDVVAGSFSGKGAGLLDLNADNLASGTLPYDRLPLISGDKLATGAVDGNTLKDGSIADADVASDAAIDFSKIAVADGAVINQMLLNDSFSVSLDGSLTTTTETVALGGTLDLSVDATNLSQTMAGWGLMAGGTQLAINLSQLEPALANDLAGKGLRHDTFDDTLAVNLGLGLTLDGSSAVVPDVDDKTIGVDGSGKLTVVGVASVPVVLDTNEPTTPVHGSLIFKDGALQVYDDPDGVGGDPGKWIKIGTYQ